jgi:hypothetical protein
MDAGRTTVDDQLTPAPPGPRWSGWSSTASGG